MSNLRDRARGNSGGNGGGKEIELAAARREFASGLERMEGQFAAAMPSGIEAKQLARDALTLVQHNPSLLTKVHDQRSLYGALMTCAQVGLRPVPQLGLAYVIPFKGKAQFVAGYKGLAQLAHRSGQLRGITNRVVRRGDLYLPPDADDVLTHKPALHRDRPEDPSVLDAVAYYAIVRDQHGGRYLHAAWRWEMEDHRERFALQREWNPESRKFDGPVKGPWVSDFDPMALKTVLKYALRVAPQSIELRSAIAADETVRTELEPTQDVESQIIDPRDIPADGEVVDAELYDPTDQEGFGTEGFRG